MIRRLDPPKQGFYTKHLRVCGVAVLAHDAVRDSALREAERRIEALLAGCPAIRANLAEAGAELHLIAEHQAVTELPMYRHMAGVPFEGTKTMDERGRGYGGLHACCGEESLLCLPSARHADHRDILTHELAHTVYSYGLDPVLRAAVDNRFRAARPLWLSAYAGTDVHEFFAELSMWWVGSRGDYGGLPSPAPGRRWLRTYDAASTQLLDELYGGTRVPAVLRWERLESSSPTRSTSGDRATSIVFHNHTDEPIELSWLDYQGVERPYGSVPAGGVCAQSTYVTHPWVVRQAGRLLGRFVPGPTPGRVDIPR